MRERERGEEEEEEKTMMEGERFQWKFVYFWKRS